MVECLAGVRLASMVLLNLWPLLSRFDNGNDNDSDNDITYS